MPITAELLFLHCSSCEREVVAEAPPCADGHDDQCPDRACVECGTALVVDVALFAITGARHGTRRAA